MGESVLFGDLVGELGKTVAFRNGADHIAREVEVAKGETCLRGESIPEPPDLLATMIS
jgi:hypothetical protein